MTADPASVAAGANSPRSPGPVRAEPGLDCFRGVVVILMFAVHVARLVVNPATTDWASRVFGFLSWTEPFIAASFLTLVGYGLTLSRARTPSVLPWRRRMMRRAIKLYGLAVGLFVLQFGVAWPDLLISPGILSAIALAIALGAALLSWPRPALSLTGVGLAVCAGAWGLDRTGATVSGLNAGPGGVVPLVAFSLWGSLMALGVARYGRSGLALSLAPLALITVAVVASGSSWVVYRSSEYPDFGGDLAVVGFVLGHASHPSLVSFWNHSAMGFWGLLLPVTVVLFGALAVRPQTAVFRWIWPWAVLGRHALVAYVGHLLVLGGLVALGLEPPHSEAGLVVVAALGSGFFLVGRFLDGLAANSRHSPGLGIRRGAC